MTDKPTCMTCTAAIDCDHFQDPWFGGIPCEAFCEYADQDAIEYGEGLYIFVDDIEALPGKNGCYPPIEEIIAHMAIVERLQGKFIAKHLGVSEAFVSQVKRKYTDLMVKYLREVIGQRKGKNE